MSYLVTWSLKFNLRPHDFFADTNKHRISYFVPRNTPRKYIKRIPCYKTHNSDFVPSISDHTCSKRSKNNDQILVCGWLIPVMSFAGIENPLLQIRSEAAKKRKKIAVWCMVSLVFLAWVRSRNSPTRRKNSFCRFPRDATTAEHAKRGFFA